MCKEIFDKLIPPVAKALEIAGFTKSDIDEIILVGGSTRIPAANKRVSDFFDGRELNN